ncbi:kinase-like protein, partial [Clavulina sp. PMI_390]
ILGVTEGLAYLHSREPPIIHGDLHPGTISLDSSGTPHLWGFGLSRIRYEVSRTRTIVQEGPKARFVAPELSASLMHRFRTSRASDIFALAMTFLYVWSGELPFKDIQNETKLASRLRRGKRPSLPNSTVALSKEVQAAFWILLMDMWAHDAALRPSSRDVIKRFEGCIGRVQKIL